jgi:hypothetical protein
VKKTLVLATSIAVLAGIWTVVVLNVGKLGPVPFVLWPTFIGWAAFFYLGANLEGARNGLVQLCTGAILAGIGVWIYAQLKVTDTNYIVLGLFVVLIAWPITALSGTSKYFAAVPAGFCGAAAWFGCMGVDPDQLIVTAAAIIPMVCGVALGWISLQLVSVVLPEKASAAAAAA